MAEVEGGRGEEILDFGFWMLDGRGRTGAGRASHWGRGILNFGCWMEDEDQERDAPAALEEGVSVACGSVARWDEEQARDAPATLEEILDFKFWMEGPAPDDSVGLPFARFPRLPRRSLREARGGGTLP
jgi:hypothetical protein